MAIQLLRIAAACLLFAAPVAAEPPLPDIALVRAKYLAAVTSIHTLDCEMRAEWTPTKRLAPVPPETALVAANIHLWKKGTSRAMSIEAFDGNGLPSIATWRGYDGKLYGHWSKPLKSKELQPWLPGGHRGGEKDNLLYEEFTVDRLTGETLFAGDLPLGQLLANPRAQIQGWSDVDGHACVLVTFPRHSKSRKLPDRLTNETTVWLDPAMQFLPRRIEWRDFVYGFEKPPLIYTQTTTSFETRTGDDDKSYILPAAGKRSTPLVDSTVRVVSVRINAPLSDDFFRPDFPPLAEIWESLPNQKPRIRIIGDSKEREQQMQHLRESTDEASPGAKRPASETTGPVTSAPPPSAAPQDATTLSFQQQTWITVGIGLCVIALLFAWRTLRASSR